MRFPPLRVALVLCAAAAVASPAAADVFDTQTRSDNDAYTGNELMHGSVQLHDLGALPGGVADNDWYRIEQRPYSSYEVVVDTTSSAIGPTLVVELIPNIGPPAQTSVPVSSLGYSRSLRFMNDTGSTVTTQYIRVRSGQCTSGCTANDTYRIRLFDTTMAAARFNNSGTQETYVFVQNTRDFSANVKVRFWDTAGASLCVTPLFTLAARDMAVIDDDDLIIHGTSQPLCASGSALGVAGSVTLLSDARYGELRAKAVALDPAGAKLEFDTEMTARRY
jgi:hypothetical protein